MKKCDGYYRRKALLENNEFPLQSEILQRHKEHLASVLKEYIGKPLQLDIGVAPPLNGAKEDVWISPSDLLVPYVRLKPPVTNKYVRALTHAGILSRDIQEKYQNEILDRFDVEMELLANKINFICKNETAKAIVEEKLRAEKQLKMEIRRVEHEYNIKLENELNGLRNRMLAEQQQKLDNQREQLNEEAIQRINDAVNENANNLLRQFQFQFELQAQKHTKDLAHAISIEEEKITKALKNANSDKLEALRILRHDLECRNMANLMYILTAERNRCEAERHKIYDEYKILIDELTSKALDLYQNILSLESMRDHYQMKLHKYESFIEQLLCEFQHFINYTFKSTPAQCEYLINLHQFVRHHTQKGNMSSLPAAHTITKNYSDSSNKLSPSILKFRTKIDKNWFLPSTYKIKKNNFNQNENNYAIKTLDESSSIASEQTLSNKHELTHLLYNKFVYIREDFRNRKSSDFEDAEDSLWLDGFESSSSSDEISLKNQTYPTSSTVHFHLKPTDEYEVTELSRNNSIPITDGQQTFINPSRVSDNSVKIDCKQPQNQRVGDKLTPINAKSQPKGRIKTNQTCSPRCSILRRASFKSSKKSVIGMITSAMNRKQPPCKQIAEEKGFNDNEDLTSRDTPLQLSAVDMVSEHTNKHSSKLVVTKNSLVLQFRKYSTAPQSLNEADEIKDANETNDIKDTNLLIKPLVTTSAVSFKLARNKDDVDFVQPSKLDLVRDSVELIKEKSGIRSDVPSASPKSKSNISPTAAVPIIASSISFKLAPNDEVRLYKLPSKKHLRDDKNAEFKKELGKDDEDIPVESVASKLTLATDSVELVKQKSSSNAQKSGTKIKPIPRATREVNRSLVLISEHTDNTDKQSIANPSLNSDDDNKNKYDDIVMKWSEANQIKINNNRTLLTSKQGNNKAASRVAIIEEPVNVILNTDVMPGSRKFNDLNELDILNPFSFNHLDIIDKQDVNDPNNYYYPQQLQRQPSVASTSNNDTNQLATKYTRHKNGNIVTSAGEDHTSLTPQEFIQTRGNSLKKRQ